MESHGLIKLLSDFPVRTLALAIIVLLNVLFFVGKWMASKAVDNLKSEWVNAKDMLKVIDSTTRLQSENHLTTIQQNTGRTVEILEQMQRDQAELLGFIKGKM